MKRRQLLKRGAIIGTLSSTGISGCLSRIEEEAQSVADEGISPSAEEQKGDKLNEVTFTRSLITKVELFEGSIIDVHLREDHNMPSIGFTHDVVRMGSSEPLSGAYKIYDAPQFSGPATYDIEPPIKNNGPFPDNKFKLKPADPDSIFLGTVEQEASFLVPAGYVSEDTLG